MFVTKENLKKMLKMEGMTSMLVQPVIAATTTVLVLNRCTDCKCSLAIQIAAATVAVVLYELFRYVKPLARKYCKVTGDFEGTLNQLLKRRNGFEEALSNDESMRLKFLYLKGRTFMPIRMLIILNLVLLVASSFITVNTVGYTIAALVTVVVGFSESYPLAATKAWSDDFFLMYANERYQKTHKNEYHKLKKEFEKACN